MQYRAVRMSAHTLTGKQRCTQRRPSVGCPISLSVSSTVPIFYCPGIVIGAIADGTSVADDVGATTSGGLIVVDELDEQS